MLSVELSAFFSTQTIKLVG